VPQECSEVIEVNCKQLYGASMERQSELERQLVSTQEHLCVASPSLGAIPKRFSLWEQARGVEAQAHSNMKLVDSAALVWSWR
jgi:hypothetical protein